MDPSSMSSSTRKDSLPVAIAIFLVLLYPSVLIIGMSYGSFREKKMSSQHLPHSGWQIYFIIFFTASTSNRKHFLLYLNTDTSLP